jgi:rhodanese-related sulfurtransferase
MYYNNQNTGNKTDYGDVSAEEAAELIKTKPSLIILDVRTETEFNEERIEHSINYPVDELEQRINELDNTDEILVYCRTGNRSGRAINIMESYGFNKIFHLAEGITEWKNAGFTTIK